MKTAISITKTQDGFDVKIPFELKDNFKKAFPSAKWNAQDKVWFVGVRSGKRAEAWVQEWAQKAQEVVETAKELKEVEATEKEYQEALRELDKLKQELQERIQRHRALDVMLADINELQAQIVETTKALRAEKSAVAEKEAEVRNVIENLIDEQAIEQAKATMSRLQGKMTSANRRMFEQAQDVINGERANLKRAGLGSHGLDDLWRINWNRPDRDKVANCRNVFDVYQLDDDE